MQGYLCRTTSHALTLAVMPLDSNSNQRSGQKFVNLRVKKRGTKGLDFIIDKLTNSIENTITGDTFTTRIIHLTKADLKTVTKQKDWVFDWKYELNQPGREVYKLTIAENVNIVQGQ